MKVRIGWGELGGLAMADMGLDVEAAPLNTHARLEALLSRISEEPERRQDIYGGTLGGPLLRNRLFFFANYQGTRFDAPGFETGKR